ncbi:phosphatase 2C-like domain-containing protein [Limtongia smithiae]|uniref:phosphatase 2C-like domain-containing protein n=1 Tax=Limtongia smithiae TaxID=1125753 RepID=UPI0034CE7202
MLLASCTGPHHLPHKNRFCAVPTPAVSQSLATSPATLRFRFRPLTSTAAALAHHTPPPQHSAPGAPAPVPAPTTAARRRSNSQSSSLLSRIAGSVSGSAAAAKQLPLPGSVSLSTAQQQQSASASSSAPPMSFASRRAKQLPKGGASTSPISTSNHGLGGSATASAGAVSPVAGSPMSTVPPMGFAGTFSVGVSEDENLKCRMSMEDAYAIVYDFGAVQPLPAHAAAQSAHFSTQSRSSKAFSLLSRAKGSLTSSTSSSSAPGKAAAPTLVETTASLPPIPVPPPSVFPIGSNSSGHISNDAGYFAVFDGHAGAEVAQWCGRKFHTLLDEHLKHDPHASVPEVLDRTFTDADEKLARLPLKNAGCTAVVAVMRWEDRVSAVPLKLMSQDAPSLDKLIRIKSSDGKSENSHAPIPDPVATSPHSSYHQSHEQAHHRRNTISGTNKFAPMAVKAESTVRERMLYTANAGDARAVLCRRGKALRLSYDHKGTDPIEAARIKNTGGVIVAGRVNGILAVTRALGDSYIKKYVTSHPFTTETYMVPDDEFLILACDGVWDVCTDQEIVNLVRRVKDPQEASKMIISHALARGSMDNLTALVVRFDPRMGEMIRKNHAPQPVEPVVEDNEDENAIADLDEIVDEKPDSAPVAEEIKKITAHIESLPTS